VANSPVYGNVSRIRGIRDAVVRLGRVNLMNCVMEVAVSAKIFRVKGYEEVMARLSVHSRATGHIAKIVSNYTWASDEFVFLCGLLHDVGLAGILIALGDVPRGRTVPELDLAMLRAVDSIHAEASAILCDLWGLPREISLVIGKHHELLVDGYPHPLASVVCLAEHIANSHALAWTGSSVSNVDRTSQRALVQAREVLKLDDKKWELIQEDAKALIQRM
jgi:HD-like signal output (HDOD) protein